MLSGTELHISWNLLSSTLGHTNYIFYAWRMSNKIGLRHTNYILRLADVKQNRLNLIEMWQIWWVTLTAFVCYPRISEEKANSYFFKRIFSHILNYFFFSNDIVKWCICLIKGPSLLYFYAQWMVGFLFRGYWGICEKWSLVSFF